MPHVKVDGDEGEEFLLADANLDELVEDEPTEIGQYTLVEKGEWKLKVVPVTKGDK
jgi:hypothetical protein